jgi:hypothetical protein
VRGSVTTLYFEGLWEETAGGAAQISYTFNNEVVAVRDSAGVVMYPHNDHLGSASSPGAVAGNQKLDALWCGMRCGLGKKEPALQCCIRRAVEQEHDPQA